MVEHKFCTFRLNGSIKSFKLFIFWLTNEPCLVYHSGVINLKAIIANNFLPVMNFRKISRIFIETLIWIIAAMFASFIRFDGFILQNTYRSIFYLGIMTAFVYFMNNIFFAVYKTQLIRASFEEILRISVSIFVTTFLVFIVRITLNFPSVPRFTPILCGILFFILQIIFRIVLSGRLNLQLIASSGGVKTLIYGSGITGQQIVDQMLHKTRSFEPVGFIDDDFSRINFMYRRRKVLGTIDDLEIIIRGTKAQILVVAISNITSANLIELERRCMDLNITLRVIPSALEIMKRNLKLSDVSTLTIEEILGRQQIDYHGEDLVSFFKNKRVLVTGAGGSIGSEIARQISRINNSGLFLLDRNENSLLELSLSINGDGLFDNNNIILCDIRDSLSVAKLIEKLKPDIVFHAAALKHLVLLEKFPEEAHKTNVVATKNLIDSCIENNTKFFINISTDKAADPISELGKTKYICERIISGINAPDKTYISVRFGNVVGSNGSFLNTFKQQIFNGSAVTVTHPEVSRYFMTIEEAVYLVLKSVLVGKCGETLILDMGEPVKIVDVAKKMIADSGKSIRISFTGLRTGEKLNEVIIGENEKFYYGDNKYIRHTRVPPIDKNAL